MKHRVIYVALIAVLLLSSLAVLPTPSMARQQLPDLVIDEIKCDRENNRIGYKITNAGDGVAPAGHKTALFVDSELLAEDEVDISLAPGDSYQGYFEDYEWTSSVGLTICADHYDDVAEAAEDNNCRESECVIKEEEGEELPPPTEKLPDLVITDILCGEPEGRIGYKITNEGYGVAPAGHTTALLVESELVGEDEVDISLAPGDSYQGYFEDYEGDESVVGFTICADHYDDVAEAAEDNNCYGSECDFREEGEERPPPPTEELPDLIVVPRYIRSISYYATVPEMLGFYYPIWNRGSAPAPATWTYLYINGRRVAEQRVDPLDAGERRDERIEVLWDCTLCTDDQIEFRLDAGDEVAEEYEVNNTRVETWRCSYLSRPRIDLVVEDIHSDPTDGKIKYTLRNRGAGESLETDSHLYIDGAEVESRRIAPLAGGGSREEYFDYGWLCTRDEDTVRVVVDGVTEVMDDCSGVEIGVGELDAGNNRAEVTWECRLPDLVIEDVSVVGGTVNYTIANRGSSPVGPTTTSLDCYEPSEENIWWRGDLIDQASDTVDALAPGESRVESVSAPCSCSPPLVHIALKADEYDSVIETYEDNNFWDFHWSCAVSGACDLSIEDIWLEGGRSRVCYEIMNLGSIASDPTTTEIFIRSSCGFFGHITQGEPELPASGSRTVCLNTSDFSPGPFDGTFCGCKRLEVEVETAPELLADPRNPHDNNSLDATFDNDNPCADGIQNHGEEGIDCGGPCPASCRDCFADAGFGHAEDAGYFRLGNTTVADTAEDALLEYANCLRDPVCRATLLVTDTLMNFSTVTVADLEGNTDYIMEAVAYYVDEHTTYMFDDDDCDICDSSPGWDLGPRGAINAVDMISRSHGRSGTLDDGTTHVDTCPTEYCGDCEDHAILREALMRSLGVSWRCAFCADHYNGYWGGGHTFNLVYYRNKWRIMDYGRLGADFSGYDDKNNPHNVWNDRVGEYWCPDWRSDPPACLYCCNRDPYSETQNYNGGEACCPDNILTYYQRCAP